MVNIKLDLARTVLRDNADATADACDATAMNVDFDNIRTFARTGEESDLVEDNGDNGPAAATPEEADEREYLVSGIQEFVFFNCLRREIEAACLPEANCQLKNLATLSDQCPEEEEEMP